jgi:hypothetical protein
VNLKGFQSPEVRKKNNKNPQDFYNWLFQCAAIKNRRMTKRYIGKNIWFKYPDLAKPSYR